MADKKKVLSEADKKKAAAVAAEKAKAAAKEKDEKSLTSANLALLKDGLPNKVMWIMASLVLITLIGRSFSRVCWCGVVWWWCVRCDDSMWTVFRSFPDAGVCRLWSIRWCCYQWWITTVVQRVMHRWVNERLVFCWERCTAERWISQTVMLYRSKRI